MKYTNLVEARLAFSRGDNVTELLRRHTDSMTNTPEIIEIAYDLQAGSYIAYVNENPIRADNYASELASLLDKNIEDGDSLLDVGTGEMTTVSLIMRRLQRTTGNVYALDLSWSRIFKGVNFASETLGANFSKLHPLVGEIGEIPLMQKSVDVVTSSHALEPNGGNESALLSELFRVARKKLVLFEPCYEINSEDGKARMDRLGYIKGLAGTVEKLGGRLVSQTTISNVANPLNPTVCFVIDPPPSKGVANKSNAQVLSVPGTSFPLTRLENFYFSKDTGISFPVIHGIPVLRSQAGVLTSVLSV